MAEARREEISYTVSCPSCGRDTLNVKELHSDLPKLGRMALFSMICSNCGYRLFDAVPLEYHGPARIEFHVKGPSDLTARVVRSSTCRVTIPELGLELRPGPKSDAFITNVEGVLDRFREVAEQLSPTSDDPERAKAILRQIEDAMAGKVEFTLVLEDDLGNSAVFFEGD